MIVKDAKGNELLEVIDVVEEQAESLYNPVNHCLAVVKVGNEYLMGWNHWRKNWEIFGGCKEDGENMRQCIIRECKEELGITLPEEALADIEKYRADKEEVEKLVFYSEIQENEPIAAIDEKLLEYWKG